MVRYASLALAAVLFGGSALRADPPRTDADGNPLPPGVLHRLGSLCWRHNHSINNSALSPDGKLLATVSWRSVVVWEVATGRIRQRFPFVGEAQYMTPGLAFSPDGSRLAYVHNGELACVLDVVTGKELRRFTAERRSENAITGSFCRFSADGGSLLLIKGKRKAFLEVATGKEVRALALDQLHLLSPDGKTYLWVEGRQAFHLGDTTTGKETVVLKVEAVLDGSAIGVAFGPDGKTLAVVDRDKEVQVRALPGGAILAAFAFPASAKREEALAEYRVGLTRDGKTLWLAGADGFVYRWDWAARKELPALGKHPSRTVNLHDLPGGQTLVTTCSDGLIRHWDAKTGKELTTPAAFVGQPVAALAKDGRRIAVGDRAGRLELWDAGSGKRLHQLLTTGSAVTQVAFTPDGKEVAAALASDEVRFWEVASGKPGRALQCAKVHNLSYVYTLAFSPDGKLLYVHDYEFVLGVWDLASGKLRWRRNLMHAALASDGKTLVASFSKSSIVYLDATSGQERFRAWLNTPVPDRNNTVQALAFAPDGAWLAVAQDTGHVALCEGATGKEVRRFVAGDPPRYSRFPLDQHAEAHSVDALAFSADGRWLATGGQDTSVRLWEVETGQELLRLNGHEEMVLGVAFGAGGRTLLSWSSDGQVLVWSLLPEPTKRTYPQRWADLLAKDAKAAYRAVWALSGDPKGAAFLRGKLEPVKPLPPERLKQWIGELNSNSFKVRSAAMQALAAAGDLARPALEQSLQKPSSAEVRVRLLRLLEALRRAPTAEELREERAVQALELADTKEGRGVLAEWASGAAGARLTRAARVALTRLEAKR